MHLGKRLAAIVLTCGLSAGLVGCGFHLKGTNRNTYCLFKNEFGASEEHR